MLKYLDISIKKTHTQIQGNKPHYYAYLKCKKLCFFFYLENVINMTIRVSMNLSLDEHILRYMF